MTERGPSRAPAPHEVDSRSNFHLDVKVIDTSVSQLVSVAKSNGHPFAKVIGLPQSLGALAAAGGAKRVVLSHLMALPTGDQAAGNFSLADTKALMAAEHSVYRGDVTLASDLRCIVPAGGSKR